MLLFFLGLILGATGVWLYSMSRNKSKAILMNAEQEVIGRPNFFDEKNTSSILKSDAIHYIKLYQRRKNLISNPRKPPSPQHPGGQDRFSNQIENTSFYSISLDYLFQLFNEWNRRQGYNFKLTPPANYKGFTGLRIYPMIYPSNYSGNRKRMMNIAIVPLMNNMEVKTYNKDNNEIIDSLPINIENQIGQYPPGTANDATLYQEVMGDTTSIEDDLP